MDSLVMQGHNLRKGPWFEEEDEQLTTIVGILGERRWDALAKASGLKRSGKSCRLRWMNYLRPNLKHGVISEEEEKTIVQLHQKWGNKWSKIARRLPGRTDNEIKNYWRSHIRKKLQAEEHIGDVINYREQNLSASNTDDTSMITQRDRSEDCMSEKDDISGSSGDSADAFEISNSAFPKSPYDTRVMEWISCWTNEQNDAKHHLNFCSVGSCFCYLTKMSRESETITWDCSSSIWNIDY